jgi:hypothetical protein
LILYNYKNICNSQDSIIPTKINFWDTLLCHACRSIDELDKQMLPCIENINKQKTNSFDRKDDLIVLQSGRAEWKGCRSTIMQSLQPTCSPWPPQWLQKF